MKKNILMISSSSELGGGTKHMFFLGESLNNQFNIFYALPKNNDFSRYQNKDNYIDISERRLSIYDIFNLKNYVQSKSIDIIHAHGKGAGLIARILKLLINKPLVYTFHGIHLECHGFLKRIIYVSYEFIMGWIDSSKILVSKSEKEFAKISKIYLGEKAVIINNGVSNKKIKKSPGLIINNNKSKDFRVISICRFVEQKNIKEILEIATHLPEIKFFIIGDGILWDEINFLIKDLKINNVFLLGKKKNVFKYLYLSDIYLSTSLYEGMPISILEAMSIGLPILATNVRGNCDTIESGKSGYLYKLNEIETAVNYLQRMVKNNNLREDFGRAAYIRQRKFFSRNYMIKKYTYLYKKQFDK